MWELLQKLEQKGWKPYGKSLAELSETEKHIRLLTSLSSGLWQFVCENGMVKKKRCGTNWEGENICYNYQDYEYWLICSALCDEDKLEQFLLDNIKIEG